MEYLQLIEHVLPIRTWHQLLKALQQRMLMNHCGEYRCRMFGGSVPGAGLLLRNGDTFGEWESRPGSRGSGANDAPKRTHSVVAESEKLILAALDRKDYTRLCEVGEIKLWIGRFWKLMTTHEPLNNADLRVLFDQLDTDVRAPVFSSSGGLCTAAEKICAGL